MKLDIRFRHMERSEALEDYVTEKITNTLEQCLHRHDAHVQVWLISDRNLTNRGTGWFVCEIEVRYPPRRDVFVQKSGAEMHAAIQEAVDAARVLIDESGKKEAHQRRQARSTPPIPAT